MKNLFLLLILFLAQTLVFAAEDSSDGSSLDSVLELATLKLEEKRVQFIENEEAGALKGTVLVLQGGLFVFEHQETIKNLPKTIANLPTTAEKTFATVVKFGDDKIVKPVANKISSLAQAIEMVKNPNLVIDKVANSLNAQKVGISQAGSAASAASGAATDATKLSKFKGAFKGGGKLAIAGMILSVASGFASGMSGDMDISAIIVLLIAEIIQVIITELLTRLIAGILCALEIPPPIAGILATLLVTLLDMFLIDPAVTEIVSLINE